MYERLNSFRLKYKTNIGRSVGKKYKYYILLIFFVYFSDTLVSYSSPSLIEKSLNNSFLMGLVISFSSIAGLLTDIIVPRFFAKKSFLFFIRYFFVFAFATSLFLLYGSENNLFILFAMFCWGVYYDFLRFFNFKYIKIQFKDNEYTSIWATNEAIRTVAFLIVPILAILLIKLSSSYVFILSLLTLLVALFIFKQLTGFHSTPLEIPENISSHFSKKNILEFLVRPILPLYIFNIALIIVDSSFWTIGIILAESLSKASFWGNFVIPAYSWPALFTAGIAGILSKKIGKKRSAFGSGIIASLILIAGLSFVNDNQIVLLIFVSSIFYSICWPQIYSAFEDYTKRVGKLDGEMMSISDSASNIGYIIGPILSGFLSSVLGYREAFQVVAGIALVTGIYGFIAMKRKVKFASTNYSSV